MGTPYQDNKNMAKEFNRALQVHGEVRKVGTPFVRILDIDTSENIRSAQGTTVPTDGDAGYAVGCTFVKTNGTVGATLYLNEGSTSSADFNAVAASAAGVTTWDALYDLDKTLTVDSTVLTFAGSSSNNDVLSLTKAGGTGDALSITNSGTGKDINGTSGAWSITKAGIIVATGLTMADSEVITLGDSSDATIQWDGSKLAVTGIIDFADNITMAASTTVVQTGLAGSTVSTITAGDVVWSDTSFAMTDADNANTMIVTNATLSSGDHGVILRFDAITDKAILYIDNGGDSLTTGSFIDCNDDGSSFFTVKSDGATLIASTANSTAALKVTGIQTSQDMVTFDNASGVIASDKAVLLLDAGGAIASGGNILRIAPTGTPNAGAIGIEYVGAGKAHQALYIDVDPTGVDAVHFHSGGALTNGFAVVGITNDGNLATGGAMLNLTLGGTPNSAARVFEIDGGSKDAIAMYVDSDAATESAVQILGAGAIANNKAMVEIVNTGTPAAAGSNLLRVDGSGLTATNKPTLVEIIGTGKDVSGLHLDTDNTTTHAVSIDGSGALNAGRMLKVDNDGTPAANTDAVAEITFTGTATNNPIVLSINNSTVDAAPLLVNSNVASATRAVGTFVQDSTTGATPVLTLDQDDVSEELMDFVSTAGSGATIDVTNTTPASIVGSAIVAYNGTKVRIALYAAAGWSA